MFAVAKLAGSIVDAEYVFEFGYLIELRTVLYCVQTTVLLAAKNNW